MLQCVSDGRIAPLQARCTCMQAIVMLHPEGQAAAAAEEAQELEAAQQAAATASRLKMPGISTRRTQLMSESPMTPRASTPCQRLASLQAIPSFPQTPDVAAAPPPEAEDFQVLAIARCSPSGAHMCSHDCHVNFEAPRACLLLC